MGLRVQSLGFEFWALGVEGWGSGFVGWGFTGATKVGASGFVV